MKHRLFVVFALLALLAVLAACSNENPSFAPAAAPANLPANAEPYLFCRTRHTQDYRQTSNSPDYDITCWKVGKP